MSAWFLALALLLGGCAEIFDILPKVTDEQVCRGRQGCQWVRRDKGVMAESDEFCECRK